VTRCLEGRFAQRASPARTQVSRSIGLSGSDRKFPGVNGPVLAYARGSEAQAVARMDNLINGLVREHARAAALQLELDFLPGLCLMPGLGLGLRF
jgi:hypothetical protein